MRASLFILLLFCLTSCKARKEALIKTDFTFERPKIYLIDSIEKSNNGIRIYPSYGIGVANDYFPKASEFKLGQPLVFIRDTASLKTQVTYFYSQPDSVIRLVEYSWDAASRKENIIPRLFTSNKVILSQFFKYPGTKIQRKEEFWSQNSTVWENDSIHVKQFMLVEREPSRTRVLVSWK